MVLTSLKINLVPNPNPPSEVLVVVLVPVQVLVQVQVQVLVQPFHSSIRACFKLETK